MLRYLQVGLIDEAFATLLLISGSEPARLLDAGLCTVVQEPSWVWPVSRWSRRKWMRDFQRTFDSLRGDLPSVLHCLDATQIPLAAALCEITGAELLLTLIDVGDVRRQLSAARAGRVPFTVLPSRRIHEACGELAADTGRVEIVPVGVPVSVSPAAFAATHRTPVVAYCGALTDDSGADLLLKAMKLVRERHPAALALLIGSGPAELRLRRLAESLEIASDVIFAGPIDHWREALADADIFCLPTASGWYEAPLHAMAAGLCIVAVEGAPYDELIPDRTAIIALPNDEASLSNRIIRLLEDRPLARELSAAAQEHVRTHNSIARMVAEYLRIYGELAGRQKTLAFPR